jgi:hypothetical protein
MTQFITVTTSQAGDAVRLNVEAILHYVRPAAETSTQILLTNGGVLSVREAMADLDDLIRNTRKAAVISGS